MDPFLGEIRIFPINFAPSGWAECNGQLLPINRYAALFSILGTAYGGDGKSTFGLPNLQGSVPLGFGSGVGLTPRDLGETGGAATVTLLQSEIPVHVHTAGAVSNEVSADASSTPGETMVFGKAEQKTGANVYVSLTPPAPPRVNMSLSAIGATGGSQPHNNMQPFLALNFCIALEGLFPTRS